MPRQLQIDKLLETVVREKISDLHITVGQPPVVRSGGRMVRLETKSLEKEDTAALMKSITPERNQQQLQERLAKKRAKKSADLQKKQEAALQKKMLEQVEEVVGVHRSSPFDAGGFNVSEEPVVGVAGAGGAAAGCGGGAGVESVAAP